MFMIYLVAGTYDVIYVKWFPFNNFEIIYVENNRE